MAEETAGWLNLQIGTQLGGIKKIFGLPEISTKAIRSTGRWVNFADNGVVSVGITFSFDVQTLASNGRGVCR